jgi:hypothetical protein
MAAKPENTELKSATAALNRLTLRAVQNADDQTLQKFYQLTLHWHEVAAPEHANRADSKKASNG